MSGRILIADDFLTNRIVLKVRLTASCYEVVQADCSNTVLETALDCNPDLIILGAGHDISASELCATIRSDLRLANTPIVVISHDAASESRLDILNAGADEILEKPLDESTLQATLRSLLRQRGTAEDMIHRHDLALEFGVAEAQGTFGAKANIGLIAPDAETGVYWRMQLAAAMKHNINIMTQSQALEDLSAHGAVPDAFIIGSSLSEQSDGLRLVSELRSRRTTRDSVIIVQDSGESPSPCSMALDLGADRAMSGEFDAVELTVKLKRLLHRKAKAEALHANMREGLELALQDPLTGLHNRRFAQTYLERLEVAAHRNATPYALMILDLDRFKNVNDNFGHIVGDEVLIAVAKRLESNMRSDDLLARFGGEEFLVALPNTSEAEARAFGDRLRRAIGDTPIHSEGADHDLRVTLSVGIAVSPSSCGNQRSAAELLQSADIALYQSKAEGRNQVTIEKSAA